MIPIKTPEEVLDLIIEALNNPTLPAHIAPNGLWSITGKTTSNLAIKIYLTPSGEISTAFPIK